MLKVQRFIYILLLLTLSPRGSIAGLTDTLKAIYDVSSSDLNQQCDLDLKNAKLEIAKDLDMKASLIAELDKTFYKKTEAEKSNSIYKFGSATFRKLGNDKLQENKWTRITFPTWFEIINAHNELKSSNSPIDQWDTLNYHFRATLRDDERRVISKRNYSLASNDGASLQNLIAEIKNCLDDSNCSRLQLSSQSQSWVHKKLYYQNDLNNILSLAYSNNFRDTLRSFYRELNLDYKYKYETRDNNHEVNKTNSEIIVRMDLSAVSPDEQKLAAEISKFWSSQELKVTVLTKPKDGFSFYKLVLSEMETRGTVSYNDQTLIISPRTELERLIHEFGHVLGLPDEYFTLWDNQNCTYYDQVNRASIMSSVSSGRVLKRHIESLKSVYFN